MATTLRLSFTRERIYLQSYIAPYGYHMCRLLEWCPTYLEHLSESLSIAETTTNLPASSIHELCDSLVLSGFQIALIHFSSGSAAVDNFSCSNTFLMN